jgi:heat shock protein HslJ
MFRTRMAALAALTAAVSTGCTATGAAPGAPASLDGTSWVLAALPGRASLVAPPATASFEGGRATGSDGCNRFVMPYATKGTGIEFGARSGASTMMACAPAVTEQSAAFMAALAGAKGYRMDAGRLQLVGADGTVLAVLSAQSQVLAGTAWSANGINNGRQAVVSLVDGSTVTMRFAEGGQVGGSGGCNDYRATYRYEGGRLSVSPPAATRRLCTTPAGIMEQEQAFFRALGTVATARIEGDRLELRTDDGALAVGLARRADP